MNSINHKKAGLVTFYYAHHYGAQLQAYALMKSIEKQGMPCDIVDYVRPDTIEGSRIFKKELSLKTILRNLHTLLHYKDMRKRADNFNQFAKQMMPLSAKSYRTTNELFANPPHYDLFLCGSDQIWNPVIYSEGDFDKAFLLSFTDQPKIAYAPSFGISDIPSDKTETLKNELDKFDSLSVREYEGAKIIKNIVDKDAPVVLDPTLLLEKKDWEKLCHTPSHNKPYMLCYFVTSGKAYFDMINMIAKEKGLEPLWLCGNRLAPKGFKMIRNAGPREFLTLFNNASFICTNSFHGTVFSILFHREFLTFSNLYQYKQVESGKNMLNSRVYTLLKKLGLSNHLVTDVSQNTTPYTIDAHNTIDYKTVDAVLDVERQHSLAFLSNAINNPTTMK